MPELFEILKAGVIGRAVEEKLVNFYCWDLRTWAKGSHRQVDDRPYGGGPGMVMMYEPLKAAIQQIKLEFMPTCKVVYLSPQGQRKKQSDLLALIASQRPILFLAGRYEGIDERIIHNYVDEEWSLVHPKIALRLPNVLALA